MNRKHRMNKSTLTIYILILICFVGIGYSSFNITKWYLDSSKTQEKIDIAQDQIVVEMVTGGVTSDIETENIDASSPYWTYIGMDLIDVNFDKLKKALLNVKNIFICVIRRRRSFRFPH